MVALCHRSTAGLTVERKLQTFRLHPAEADNHLHLAAFLFSRNQEASDASSTLLFSSTFLLSEVLTNHQARAPLPSPPDCRDLLRSLHLRTHLFFSWRPRRSSSGPGPERSGGYRRGCWLGLSPAPRSEPAEETGRGRQIKVTLPSASTSVRRR